MVKIIKVKKGVPTVIIYEGCTYILRGKEMLHMPMKPSEEQLDEIVKIYVQAPIDEEDRAHKMRILGLVSDLRNSRVGLNHAVEFLKVFTPSVVYSALRHYYKQGLFKHDEFDALEKAKDSITEIEAFLSSLSEDKL